MPVRIADIPQHLAGKLGVSTDNIRVIPLVSTPGTVKAEVRTSDDRTIDLAVDQYTGDYQETDFWRPSGHQG